MANATDTYRRHSDRLGTVTIPPRDCPDTGEYEHECPCAYHVTQRAAADVFDAIAADETGWI